MTNSGTLDTIIAIVTTLLVLSLVVQSIQSVLKKLFKIKSRQIEESLVDLFKNVLDKPPVKLTGWLDKLIDHSPMLRILFYKQQGAAERAGVKDVYDRVMKEFAQVGRLAQSGKQMLDSIAKDDLLKILDKVPVEHLLPDFKGAVASAFEKVKLLEKDLTEAKEAASKAAPEEFAIVSAEYSSIQVMLTPLFNDVQSEIDTHRVVVPAFPAAAPLKDGTIPPALLNGNLAALRWVKPEELLARLANLQKKVDELRTHATDPARVGALTAFGTDLGGIAGRIGDLRHKLDAVQATFQGKLGEVNNWYDTVMQGFEERYNRSMKSWAIITGFLVVVLLNANFFSIYRTFAASDATRSEVINQGSEILRLSKEQTAAAASVDSEGKERKAADKEADVKRIQKEMDAAVQKIRDNAALYTGIGLTPLRWPQVTGWFSGLIPVELFSGPAWKVWGQSRRHDLVVLIGWLITTILLSIGAPFWQDTLESLFGVKTLLRKKADIKNVEAESGAGQPKP